MIFCGKLLRTRLPLLQESEGESVNINKKLKMLREKGSMTQQDAAELFGTSLSTYQKYERDKNPNQPSTEMLMQIAKYYNVSLDWLLDMPGAEKGTPLDEFAQREHLKTLEKLFMQKYLELTSEQRDKVLDFLREIVADEAAAAAAAEEARNNMEIVRTAARKPTADNAPHTEAYPKELLDEMDRTAPRTDSDM